MPPLMEVHVTPDPLQLGLFGAERQVPKPHPVARHLEQSRWISHAPYLPGKLGDISTAAGQWNQHIDPRSRRLSDDCVQFLSPVWAVYL